MKKNNQLLKKGSTSSGCVLSERQCKAGFPTRKVVRDRAVGRLTEHYPPPVLILTHSAYCVSKSEQLCAVGLGAALAASDLGCMRGERGREKDGMTEPTLIREHKWIEYIFSGFFILFLALSGHFYTCRLICKLA